MFLETHYRFELNFMIPWGMVSYKVIVVSAGGISEFLTFLLTSLAATTKAMITVENDIVAGDELLRLRGNFYDSFESIRNDRHLFDLFCFFFVKTSELPPLGPEVKWDA